MSKKQVILTGAVAALASVALQGSAIAATTGVVSPVVQSAKLLPVDASAPCGSCPSSDGCGATCGCCESLGCGECGSCEEGNCGGADSN